LSRGIPFFSTMVFSPQLRILSIFHAGSMAASTKQIAHLDLDCFFVSVERLKDPALVGKPVAVGGAPGGRGVVASASYEARAFGVRSAMSTARALRLCPKLIVVRSQHHEYGEISDTLAARMEQVAPVVERASIDEMYMDFTGCEALYNNDLAGFMRTIQKLVADEFHLPCSIALATSKTLAKIAVGTVKPNGVCVVPAGQEEQFLAPLPIAVIPGVGEKTEEALQARGFHRISDLQRATEEQLVHLLGASGRWLHAVAHGRGSDAVCVDHTRKSISREETFGQDLRSIPGLEAELHALVEDVSATLRGKGWRVRTVQLKLRYANFTTITRARTVDPTDDDPVIFATVKSLFHGAYDKRQAVRLLGVHLSNFDDSAQLELSLNPQREHREELLKAVDKIRARFGDDVIHVGHA
jgi:DNA polymerase IV